MKQKNIFAITILLLLTISVKAQPEFSRAAINALRWGRDSVIVIGHMHPDCDATCSAMAYAYLMNQMGHKCVARIASSLNNEMSYACKKLGIRAPEVQEKIEPGQQLILVDHSNYAQAVDGARNGQVLQIIDHHNLGDVTSSKPIYAKIMPVGSTCTIVFSEFQHFDVPIPDDIAKILLTGIISDTKNLTMAGLNSDSIALFQLARQLNMSDSAINRYDKGLRYAAESYPKWMSDSDIYESDYKNYPEINGIKIGITTLHWHDQNTLKEFLQRMYNVSETIMKHEGTDMTFAMVHAYRSKLIKSKRVKSAAAEEEEIDDLPNGTYLVYFGNGAKEVAEAAYGKSVGRSWVYSPVVQTRKSNVVPKLTAAIRGIKK